jgi:NADPH:quinone reductase
MTAIARQSVRWRQRPSSSCTNFCSFVEVPVVLVAKFSFRFFIMRAITQFAFGQASTSLRASCFVYFDSFTDPSSFFVCEQLSSVPRPSPCANDVLLRILASSVNALDVRMVSGYGRCAASTSYFLVVTSQFHRRLFERRLRHQVSSFLGRDAVGVVVERGSAVQSRLQLGSRVAVTSLPIQGSGFWSEFATAPAFDCAVLPDSIPTETAAALPYAALTALQSLQNRVFQGTRVLVHGGQFLSSSHSPPHMRLFIQVFNVTPKFVSGAGGVGHIAIQFCVAAGAAVSATCSSQQRAFVMQQGAVAAHDFQDSNWLSSCGHFDVILDTVGGVVTELSVKLLSPGGVVVCLAGDVVKNIDSEGVAAGLMKSARQWMNLQQHLRSPQVVWHMNRADGDTLRNAVKMLSSGQLQPHVERRLALNEVIGHVEVLQQGGTTSSATGKTIVML